MKTKNSNTSAPIIKKISSGSKFKPILFSTEMVASILKGEKSMTRRIVNENIPLGNWEETLKHCPYKVGDILWVRETWLWLKTKDCEGRKTRNYYKTEHHPSNNEWLKESGYKWTPSIHMPKDASRLFLEVTHIRIERLKEITEEDAAKEGVQKQFSHLFQEWRFKDYANVKDDWRTAVSSFQSLWASIYGFNSWDENPFLWVYSFKVVERPNGF